MTHFYIFQSFSNKFFRVFVKRKYFSLFKASEIGFHRNNTDFNFWLKVKYSWSHYVAYFLGNMYQVAVPIGRTRRRINTRRLRRRNPCNYAALRLAALSEIPINRNQGWVPWLKPRDGNGADIAPYINRIRRWIVNSGNSCVREWRL